MDDFKKEDIQVTVSREDGKPICTGAGQHTVLLTDQNPVLIIKKDGGTVETFSGGIFELLEFTIGQLEGMGVRERNDIYKAFGLDFNSILKS